MTVNYVCDCLIYDIEVGLCVSINVLVMSECEFLLIIFMWNLVVVYIS